MLSERINEAAVTATAELEGLKTRVQTALAFVEQRARLPYSPRVLDGVFSPLFA